MRSGKGDDRVKRFTISGSFPALDLEDAFARLAWHFEDLRHPPAEPIYSRFPGEHSITIEPEAEPATERAEAS